MGISINTNVAATRASYYLSRNQEALHKSLDRLSSGKRITEPADDAGGLAVSMKLESATARLSAVEKNISNAISFKQVQDGILSTASKIVARMGELKSLYHDVIKDQSDQDTYDAEFADLQSQLWQLAQTKFNGIRLFGAYDASDVLRTGNNVFGTNDSHADVTLDVYTSEDGSAGPSIALQQSLLLSALTLSPDGAGNFPVRATGWDETNTNVGDGNGVKTGDYTIAVQTAAKAMSLDDLDTEFLTTALQNLATLRANNGAQVNRLRYAKENAETQRVNLEAANGRIMDVDVASESSNLARQQVLVQASASMTAQARMSTEVALLLLS